MKLLILGILLTYLSCDYQYTITKWQDGIVPYYIQGDFTDSEMKLLKDSMKKWESVCNVKFTETSPRSNAYKIMKGELWYSTIGESMDFKYMVFGNPVEERHILHELAHCLGFLHEHQRADRNKYINIIWERVNPSATTDFTIHNNPLYNEESFNYDFDSIMHYHGTAFSTDGKPTITAYDGRELKINKEISDTDKKKAVLIYGEVVEDKDI